ncbi:MAG: hypothetical protein OEV42_10550 [Deltaproteobacteria bacterium]|nr:hypothetical protein [Deltaproteobacteria bacterium]
MKYLVLLLMTAAFSDAPKDSAINKRVSGEKLSSHFKLVSNGLENGGNIPRVNVCQWLGGENKSPHLAWTSPPDNSESFALIMTDRGHGGRERETKHWTVYNIPKNISNFSLGEKLGRIEGIVEGKEGYRGPCPGEKHLYRFVLFALNKDMPLIEKGTSLSESEFVNAYEPYILASTALEGYFEPSSLRLFINKIKRVISGILE